MLKLILLVLISVSPSFAQYHSGTITAKRVVLSTGTTEIGRIGFSTVAAQQLGDWVVKNSTVGVVQSGAFKIEVGSGTSVMGQVKIIDNDGNVAKVDTAGRMYVNPGVSSELFFAADDGGSTAITAGIDNPILLVVNPSTSAYVFRLQSRIAGMVVANVPCVFRLWEKAVITSSGTAIIVVDVGKTDDISKAQVYRLPTLSSLGIVIDSFPQGSNTNAIQNDDKGQIYLLPGENWVFTANPYSNNKQQYTSIKWTEEPQ